MYIRTFARVLHGFFFAAFPKTSIAPRKVELSEKVVSVHAGMFHSVIVTSEGDVLTCGYSDCGRLGRAGDTRIPARVELPSPVESVQCGSSHCVVHTALGLYSFGLGSANAEGTSTVVATTHCTLLGWGTAANHTWTFCKESLVDRLEDVAIVGVSNGLMLSLPPRLPRSWRALRAEFAEDAACLGLRHRR